MNDNKTFVDNGLHNKKPVEYWEGELKVHRDGNGCWSNNSPKAVSEGLQSAIDFRRELPYEYAEMHGMVYSDGTLPGMLPGYVKKKGFYYTVKTDFSDKPETGDKYEYQTPTYPNFSQWEDKPETGEADEDNSWDIVEREQLSWALRKLASYQKTKAHCPSCGSHNLGDYSSDIESGTIYVDCNDCYDRNLYWEMMDGSVVKQGEDYVEEDTVYWRYNEHLRNAGEGGSPERIANLKIAWSPEWDSDASLKSDDDSELGGK